MSSKGVSFLFLGLLFAVLSFFLLNRGEDMAFYRVMVGNQEASYYVMEDTTRIYIEDVISSSIHNDAYLSKNLLEVPLKDLNVKVQAYECVDKGSSKVLNCKSFYENDKEPNLNPIEKEVTSYKIMKEDKVIYEGKYIENLETVIKEKGQYYFILTYEENVSKAIKETKILFSIKVR